MADFGRNIKELRQRRGWNAEELARRSGVSPATIYRYENGSIDAAPVDKIAPIANALGVSPAVIMGWEKIHDSYEQIGVAARIDDSIKKSPLDKIIDQLMEYRKTAAASLAPDELRLIDAYRHMTTATQKKLRDIAEKWQDF